jgi:hypothetical protein
VTIAFEMRTPLERAAPAELKFWINGEEAATGTVRAHRARAFTASETFDVGMDTSSPVADAYFDRRPSPSRGRLEAAAFREPAGGRPSRWCRTIDAIN